MFYATAQNTAGPPGLAQEQQMRTAPKFGAVFYYTDTAVIFIPETNQKTA